MAVPTKSKLRSGARHVDAEIEMLIHTAIYLRNPGAHRSTHDATIRKALLESWCIHLRCLIEFFHPTRPDVLRAEYYVEDSAAWSAICPKLTKREKRRRKALHELIAHLAVGRDARKSKWSEKDHNIVARRVALFMEHVSSRRKKWFPEATHWFKNGNFEIPKLDL
jgi:hypothetical protein